MDVLENPALVHQLDSSATNNLVKEDRSSGAFVVGEKFLSYSDLKKELSEFEESKSVQLFYPGSSTIT